MNQKEIILKVANEYLTKGFSVIPVKGKVPCVPSWTEFQKAPMSSEALAAAIEKTDPTGLAVICGKVSGIVVVDVDSEDANTKLQAVGFPKTWTAKTARGYHYYFKYPRDGVSTSLNRIEKVDIKSDGGYVVAPPSLHESGHQYNWTVGMDTEMAEFPDEFFASVRTVPPPPSGDKDWSKILTGVHEGERNIRMTRIAGKYLSRIPEYEWNELVLPTLQLINKQNVPPLDSREVVSIFNSVSKSEREKRKTATNKAELKIMSVKDLYDRTDIKLEFLIENLIPENGVNVLSGNSGAGKTWVMLEMAKSVASGKPFLGQFAVKQGAVLVVDGEGGLPGTKSKMELLRLEATLPIYILSEQTVKIDDDKTRDELLLKAKALGIKLVVFDPFSALHSKPENNNDEIQKVMEAMQEFNKIGITVLFLHHHRKEYSTQSSSPSQTLRGSSILITRPASHGFISSKAEGTAHRIRYTQVKLRDGREIPPFDIYREEDEDGMHLRHAGESVDVETTKVATAIEMIPEVLGLEGKTKKEIVQLMEAQDIAMRTTQTALSSLLKSGKITRQKRGKENLYLPPPNPDENM